MANKFFRFLPALAAALLVGALSTAAFASDTYTAGKPRKDGNGGWNVFVMNDEGWGVIVNRPTRRQARKAGEEKAAEFNAEGPEACFDICLAHPDLCG